MERKNKKPYITILWLGLDGLRINNDSSLEWISKNTTLPEKNFCNINASSIINTIQYDNISS